MNNIDFKEIADELFYMYIEINPESGKGEYLSKSTNQILSFDEYLSSLTREEICKQIKELTGKSIKITEIDKLKKIINNGIEKYLADNIKTLAIR